LKQHCERYKPPKKASNISLTTPKRKINQRSNKNNKMATESHSHPWGPVNFDTDAKMSNDSTSVDYVDCDFLAMEIEIPSTSSHASFGLDLSPDDPRRNSLSMMSVISDCDYAPPRSPPPKRHRSFKFSNEVSPDAKNEHVPLPGLAELQMEYQNSLKKLAKSMQRSDMTRSVIKLQRKVTPSLSFESENAKDFFAGPRMQQLEQSRKRLLCVINRDE
jgi:hypothetical protein